VKSSTHSIAGLVRPSWSHWIIVDQAMFGQRVLGEFSSVIAPAANRARCAQCLPFDGVGREALL